MKCEGHIELRATAQTRGTGCRGAIQRNRFPESRPTTGDRHDPGKRVVEGLLDKLSGLLVDIFRIVALRNATGVVYGLILGVVFLGTLPYFIEDPSPWLCFSAGILIVNLRKLLQLIRGEEIYDEELRRKLAIVDEYRKRGGDPQDVRRLYFEIAKSEVERPGSEPEAIRACQHDDKATD